MVIESNMFVSPERFGNVGQPLLAVRISLKCLIFATTDSQEWLSYIAVYFMVIRVDRYPERVTVLICDSIVKPANSIYQLPFISLYRQSYKIVSYRISQESVIVWL